MPGTRNRTTGATVVENSISRAQLALQVDEITGLTTLKDNLIGLVPKGDLSCHNPSLGSKPMAAVNISPASWAHLSPESVADLEMLRRQLPRQGLFSEIDHDYCVPYPNNSRIRSYVDLRNLSDADNNGGNNDSHDNFDTDTDKNESSTYDVVDEANKLVREEDLELKDPRIVELIQGLYQHVLGRGAQIDASGFEYFYEAFEKDRTLSGCQTLVRDFYRFDEFKQRSLTDRQYVTSLYWATLGYGPDSEGLKFHSNHLSQGQMTRKQKLDDFINHADSKARYQTFL